MSNIKYSVSLTDKERETLTRIIEENSLSPRTIVRARILLECDKYDYGREIRGKDMAEVLGTTRATIQTVRADFGKGGLEYALYNKRSAPDMKTRNLNTEVIDRIREMASEEPPKGKKRWTVRLLCSECMDRKIVPHISVGAMSQLLNKYNIEIKEP